MVLPLSMVAHVVQLTESPSSASDSDSAGALSTMLANTVAAIDNFCAFCKKACLAPFGQCPAAKAGPPYISMVAHIVTATPTCPKTCGPCPASGSGAAPYISMVAHTVTASPTCPSACPKACPSACPKDSSSPCPKTCPSPCSKPCWLKTACGDMISLSCLENACPAACAKACPSACPKTSCPETSCPKTSCPKASCSQPCSRPCWLNSACQDMLALSCLDKPKF